MTNSGCQRRLTRVLLASAAITSFAAPAFAQDEPTREDIAQPADEAATADAGDIIVTARRRQESLQDTPVAISAVNAEMLENKASVNIGDLVGAVPNLLITSQNS